VLDLPVLHAAHLALPGAAVLTLTCIATPAVVGRIGKRAALIACHFSIAGGLLLILPTGVTAGDRLGATPSRWRPWRRTGGEVR
jgi:DHA2 family multidrug resistance protein-like MFS transporter